MKLSATKAKAISKPGMYGDGLGLYLNIKKTGTRSWIFRATVDERRREIGLGPYPAVSLALARERAAAHRITVAEGGNPLMQKQKIPIFRDAARIVHAQNIKLWRVTHGKQWMQSLSRHVFPVIGDKTLDQIGRGDVLAVLEPIWTTRSETARRVRQRIKMVMRYGQAHGFLEINPAGEAIDGALAPMAKITNGHHRALAYRDVPEALQRIRTGGDFVAAKLCIEFLILTASRSGEARGARWSEIDMETAVWTIPAERMKAGIPHRVPLSDAAMSILDEAREISDGSDIVFPSSRRARKGKGISVSMLMLVLGNWVVSQDVV